MNTKIYMLTALAMCIGLLLTGFPAGAGQIETSVTLSVSGVIQQTPTPTPTPTPTEPYSYIISVSGSNYQMTDGTTGQIVFQSTNSSQVFSNVVGNCSVGSSIDVESGVYVVNTMWTMIHVNNVTMNFESGAKLVAGINLNAPVLFLKNVDNWLIQGVTIDGNSQGQSQVPTTSDWNDGIKITGGTNNLIDRANITNCGREAVFIEGYNDSSTHWISTDNGVTNSKLYNCGWNGVTIYGKNSTFRDYSINNEISGCSDVGISTYGTDSLIINNYVHDLNGTSGGGGNAQWGIAVEGGSNAVIMQNSINNTRWGIAVDNSGISQLGTTSNTTISNNKVFNSKTGGIHLTYGASANLVTGNQITTVSSPGDSYYAFGIYLQNSTFNNITGNYVSQSDVYGIYLDRYSNNNMLTGNIVFNNGQAGTGAQVGIAIYGSNNQLYQNQAYDNRAGAARTQQYGIRVYPDYTPTGNVLIGNNATNNLNYNIYDPNVPESTMINNTGYNPVGPIAHPISGISAYLVDLGGNSTWISGRVYTNTGSPKVLNISGGTVSFVAQNGVTLFTATGCTVTLQPGDTFSVTFSTAPTINVIGQ